MILWLDAHLSPSLAPWISSEFDGMEAAALRDLGLRDAEDWEIFNAARDAGAVVITKDGDFTGLVERLGPPPRIIWIRCGNTSNARMREILADKLIAVASLIDAGESLVEINCE